MKRPEFIGLHSMAWLAVAGLAVYLFLAVLISGEALQKISTSLNLGVSVAIVFSWAPAAFYAIRRRALGKNQIVIAIFTMFAVFIVVRAYSVAYVAFGTPETWPNAIIIGLFGYLIFLSGALFLIAPANVDNPEAAFFRQLKWALLLGSATAALAYWAQIVGILN
jgi:hypothetical protein